MTDSMIRTKEIRKSFGTLEVLKGIDLLVERGEVVEKLHNVDIETLTPLEALNFLYELKNTLDKD